MRGHVLGDAIGDPAGVEHVGAAGRDRLQALGEVRQHEPIARGPCRAIRLAVRGERCGIRLHRARDFTREAARERRRDHEALRRELRRGRDDVFPRQLAEALVRERHAAHGARHARREIARGREIARDLAVWPEVHRLRRFRGRGLAVVERRRFAASGAHDHESAAAEVAGERVRDGHRKRGRDGRVDGVAALGQNRRAEIRCDVR